jgi:hypothetical protein
MLKSGVSMSVLLFPPDFEMLSIVTPFFSRKVNFFYYSFMQA